MIFAHYAGEVPQQMRQFMPPQPGSIPYEHAATACASPSTKANVVVKEWNMAKEPNAPEPDKDTQAVYVFLPPPQDMPMPGPAERTRTSSAMSTSAQGQRDPGQGRPGIFLCKWEAAEPRRRVDAAEPSRSTPTTDLLRESTASTCSASTARSTACRSSATGGNTA